MSSPRPLLGVLVLTLAGAGAASGAAPDPLAAQLRRCAGLAEAGARLACYDALAGSPAATGVGATAGLAASTPSMAGKSGKQMAATNSGAATAAVAASAATPTPSVADFGVHNGPLEERQGPVREKRMLAVISGVSTRPNGEVVVTLDNGQVWAQIQSANYPVEPGDHVEIDVAALGSYVLWSPSKRRVMKVTRVK